MERNKSCMNYRRIVHLSILLLLCLTSAVVSGNSSGTCTISQETHSHKGLVVDCQKQSFNSEMVKSLNFTGMTTLLLSNNDIRVLLNHSFVQHVGLRKLVCESCNMHFLEHDALNGLFKLEFLGLANNRLKIVDKAFPLGVFRHVPNLKTLHIGYNGNYGRASNYSEFIDLFDTLENLEDLSIDSFSRLRISEEFTRLTLLNRLTIVCENLQQLSDNSFDGFQKSNVKHLVLKEVAIFNNQIDNMAFQFLPNISSLTLSSFLIGNTHVLGLMQSLQGRHMDEIKFQETHSKFEKTASKRLRQSSLRLKDTKYLTNICVSHFSWVHIEITDIEAGAFISGLWSQCLKSFYLLKTRRSDLIYSNQIDLFLVGHYKKLNSFVIMKEPFMSIGQNFWHQDSDILPGRYKMGNPHLPLVLDPILHRNKRDTFCSNSSGDFLQFYDFSEPNAKRAIGKDTASETNEIVSFNKSDSKTMRDNGNALSMANIAKHDFIRKRSPLIVLKILPASKILVLDDIGTVRIPVDVTISDNVLQHLYLRRNVGGGIEIDGKVLGLNHLLVIDFSYSKISLNTSPQILKFFPSLKRLVLVNTKREARFYSDAAENCPKLEYFDVADNSMMWLPENVFHSNKELKYLSLGRNRFSNIPLNLDLTPNLEILDLRTNLLIDLPRGIRQAIDSHVRGGQKLTLLLDKNPFSCTCSTLPFLKWLLYTSRVQFDKEGNYTCFAEDGTKSFTALHSDLQSFWRQCQGRSYFLVSLILTFTFATLYLGAYLTISHKTQIMSKVMQLVTPGFRLLTRQDFLYDVCIGYADQDGDYVRHTLLRYLENMWQLRTFVHQRDLLQDPLMMSQAIRDSWRNVLLITNNFLDRHPTSHNVMKVSTFFVRPSNPHNVIVMVTESVRHRIPDYVLQVLHEDNIIFLNRLGPFLDYETKEMLKNRILN